MTNMNTNLDASHASVATRATESPPAGFRERSVALAHGKVNYVEGGQGKTLLLLHGGYGNWRHWHANLGALAAHFHVVGMDMPGFGKSDALKETPTIPTLAAAVSEAMNRMSRDRDDARAPYSVLAFSFGTTVAVRMAADRPERIAAMLLLSPPGILPVPDELLALQNRASETASREGFMAGVRLTAHETMLWDHGLIDDTVLDIIASGVNGCRVKTREMSRAMPMLEAMQTLPMPIRVLYGEHDPFYRSRIDEFLACTREVIGPRGADRVQDCSHWIQYEKPQLTLQEAVSLFEPERA
ncbi:MAG: alpha/beta hydrolase [Candidimonas sp.]